VSAYTTSGTGDLRLVSCTGGAGTRRQLGGCVFDLPSTSAAALPVGRVVLQYVPGGRALTAPRGIGASALGGAGVPAELDVPAAGLDMVATVEAGASATAAERIASARRPRVLGRLVKRGLRPGRSQIRVPLTKVGKRAAQGLGKVTLRVRLTPRGLGDRMATDYRAVLSVRR
jgi:hypothetical protein